MPRFSYRAVDKKGTQVSDTVQADSLALAIDYVRSLGQFPTSISEEQQEDAPASHLKRHRFSLLSGWRVRDREVCRFARDLANMVGAGLSLSFSLSILHDRQEPGEFKNIVGELATDVGNGMKFSEALAKHPEVFDDFFISMVRTSESNGSLQESLVRLTEAEENTEGLESNKRRGTMIFLAGIAIGWYVHFFIAPKVAGMLFYEELNLAPRMLYGLYKCYWYIWTATFICVSMLYFGFRFFPRIRVLRKVRDTIAFKLPISRRRVQRKNAAYLARTMGALLGNNMTPAEALAVAEKTVPNFAVAKALRIAREKVSRGEPFVDVLRASSILPSTALEVIAAREDTDGLDVAMLKVADLHDAEGRMRQHAFSEAMFWKVMIAVSGIATLALLLAFFKFLDTGRLI